MAVWKLVGETARSSQPVEPFPAVRTSPLCASGSAHGGVRTSRPGGRVWLELGPAFLLTDFSPAFPTAVEVTVQNPGLGLYQAHLVRVLAQLCPPCQKFGPVTLGTQPEKSLAWRRHTVCPGQCGLCCSCRRGKEPPPSPVRSG